MDASPRRGFSSLPWGARGALAIFFAMAAFWAAGAQPEQHRELVRVQEPADTPWLRINAGGHTAAVYGLAFTPDGKRFCSGGLDKAVQVWNLSAVTRDLRRTFLRERTIRWQVARGLRGSIYALAATRGDPPREEDGLLAFGGYGATMGLGEILLVNPVDVDRTPVKVLQGHRQAIAALAFSADGNWLASSDVGGQVILRRRGDWQPRTLYEADQKTYADPELVRLIQEQPKLRPVVVAGSTEVIVPVCVGRQPGGRLGWKLHRIAVDKPSVFRSLDSVHHGMVSALAASRDGTRLASADLAGKLLLWALKGDGPPAELDPQAIVRSLCFSPDGRTLVAGTAIDAKQKTGQLQVWDVATGTLKRRQSLEGEVRACAVSPDGRDVAYVGGKDNEVFVEALEAPERKLALRGTGRRILRVAFARNQPPYRIAFGTKVHERDFNDYADLEESFDPVRLELGASGAIKPSDWLSADRFRGAWSARPQSGGVLQLYRDGVTQGQVVLDPAWEGQARSYCWMANAKGEPSAIAVGTDVQNSVYVYRLVAEGRCPILRHFRGHHSYVASLSVSSDLRYLASASADGTIIFWSLAALERGEEPLGRWGAELAVEGERLVAKSVHPAGPLFGKGVRGGDVIQEIQWNDGQADKSEKRPAEILKRLRGLPWGTQVLFAYARNGVRRPAFQLLPAWQPLATLFVGADREWAFWTPQGYYDASINGHTRFGWQINRGLQGLPDFFRADQFRKKLERPDVMEWLLPAGSLEQALEAARLAPPRESHQVLPEQIAATPRLEILSPRPGQLVPGNVTRLRARIVMPGAASIVQAKVFANGVAASGRRLVEERDVAGGKELVYDWDVPLPSDPKSLIQLFVGTDAPTAAFGKILVERPPGVRPDRPARLRIIALGIDKYADRAVRPLSFAVADAEAVVKALREKSEGLYTVDRAVVLKNEQVTPEGWRKTLEEVCGDLRNRAQPDDLLVVFFAGHGILDPQSGEYYYVGHDFKVADLQRRQYAACISWNDFRALAGISCRKLVFLDTCHAGAIQPLRARDLKSAVRELQEDVVLTFAASAGDEQSAERKSWGHGAFTKSLLEALAGQDPASSRPAITLNEVVDYVRSSVRQLTGGRQNPAAAPDDVLPFTAVILARRGQP